MKKIVVPLVALSFALASCSKTVVLTDGSKTKSIKAVGAVTVKTDENQNKILVFESAKGTHYRINTLGYDYSIK